MTFASTATDRRPRLSPHFMFRWEASQDAYILLYPEGLIKLNPSAGEILKRCDGKHTVAELIAELQDAFPGPADDIDQGVRAFLDVATDKGWLHAGELVKKS